MSVYQAGRGLDRRALQRLLDRKGASQGVLKELPSEDQSKQWEGLIGGGKKKLRCSQCTRPIDPDAPTARQLLCGKCSSADVQADPPRRAHGHRESLALDSCVDEASQAQELCRTPSTEANSEELAMTTQPPTPQDVEFSSLRKQLAGEWLGQEGKRYNVVFDGHHDIRVTCVHKEKSVQLDVPLYLDVRERYLWWGPSRLYFLDLSEVDWASEQLTSVIWRVGVDLGNGSRPDMEWQRPLPEPIKRQEGNILASQEGDKQVRVQRWARRTTPENSTEQEAVAKTGAFAPEANVPEAEATEEASVEPAKPRQHKVQNSTRAVWKPVVRAEPADTQSKEAPAESKKPPADEKVHQKCTTEDDLAAEALREIVSQLKWPGNGGYVWVDDWNERFSASLGTVRNFIESRPDKFKVTPTSGRGYRVMLVSETQPSKPVWRKRQS